jgi:dihydrofolate reductase
MLKKRDKVLTLIAAVGKRRVIGVGNKLPWDIREDLAYFKEKTTGKDVIVGRKTFLSLIDATDGKLLPGRNLIVVGSSFSADADDRYQRAFDVQDAIDKANRSDEVFIAGGADIYLQTIDDADRLYITEVNMFVVGGRGEKLSFFPHIDERRWKKISESRWHVQDKETPPFRHLVYERPLQK